MSTITIKQNATALAVTAGTDLTLTETARAAGKVIYVDLAQTDFRLRRKLQVTGKDPQVDKSKPSGYTQARGEVIATVPVTLTSGAVTYSNVKISVGFDVEMSTAARKELLYLAYQSAINSTLLDMVVSQAV